MAAKPILVFLHYFGGSSKSWNKVINLLSADYHCFALDMAGFGHEPALSEPSITLIAKNVEEQLDLKEIDDYILIGHSMGGKIALQVAADLSQRQTIQQMILIAPSPPTVERMQERDRQRMLIHPDQQQSETTVKNSTVKTLTPDLFSMAVETQLITDQHTWNWWINEGINESITLAAGKITIPITVIASTTDPAVTYEMITDDCMPNLPGQAQLLSTAGIGHLFPLEDAEWTANCISNIAQSERSTLRSV
jgi:pimeloyl-ACP methyl ester carboxylesterase